MSINNNVEKILTTYVKPVSVEHCKHLILNESLFKKDGCDICGRCCGYWDPVLLPFEVNNIRKIASDASKLDTNNHLGGSIEVINELLSSLEEIEIEVNGKSKLLYKSHLPPTIHTFSDRGTLKRCHWLVNVGENKLGCSIHQVESLTCQFPHIRLNYNSKRMSTHIGTTQYGRNWALKCPVNFKEEFDISTVRKVLYKFELLKKYCEYFEVDNYCQIILDLIQSVKEASDIQRICGRDILVSNKEESLF